ncbi:hypothetical protein EDB92DRAFT_842381 [Lactarius akahatsu]|uniref:Secreted protein n=1 Tax=Lactarius akahatsu TaxID=416441 RepID=A0AAD4LJM9_9AGAM|nr:hypothetical protein EDB92DRAFT_842381 [Lactarius akahatsu]
MSMCWARAQSWVRAKVLSLVLVSLPSCNRDRKILQPIISPPIKPTAYRFSRKQNHATELLRIVMLSPTVFWSQGYQSMPRSGFMTAIAIVSHAPRHRALQTFHPDLVFLSACYRSVSNELLYLTAAQRSIANSEAC